MSMQSNPRREKMSVTWWLRREGVKRYCCEWCMKPKHRIHNSNFNGPNNSKRVTLRTHRTGR